MTGRLCNWCKIKRGWRSRWRLCGFCRSCHGRACCEAGIYLQSGGPEFAHGSRKGFTE